MGKSVYLWVLSPLLITACRQDGEQTVTVEGQRISITEETAADTEIEEFIAPYRKRVDENLDEVLAYNKNHMVKTDGELNTAIGNLMADIVLDRANPVFNSRTGRDIDFVLLNHGGIRAAMQEGGVTPRTAYEVMPFENEIVVLEMPGRSIEKMLRYLERAKRAHPVSGIKIRMGRDYKLMSCNIQRVPFRPDRTYFVATSDYLRDGGDNMTFFAESVGGVNLNYKIRNAMIDYFTEVDTIDYRTDDRFIFVEN